MKKHIILFWLTCLISLPSFATELGQINETQLLTMQHQEKALVIDIRTNQEWQASGIIPGSDKLEAFDSNGEFNQSKWVAELEKLKTAPDQTVILVCRSGNRSSKLGKILTEQLGMKNVYHLSNGIQSWIKSGQSMQPNCPESRCQ